MPLSSNPAGILQLRDLRARNRRFDLTIQNQPDITALPLHIINREPCDPPAAVDLPAIDSKLQKKRPPAITPGVFNDPDLWGGAVRDVNLRPLC